MGNRDDLRYLKYRRWYEKKTADSRKFNREYVTFQKRVISELGYAVPLDELKTKYDNQNEQTTSTDDTQSNTEINSESE
jgi:hypothetical protein